MSAARSAKKVVASIAIAAATVAAGVAIGPGAAHASGTTVRLAPMSNPFLYVDVSGASTDTLARIIQWPLAGDNQVWTFRLVAGPDYLLVNKHSNKCLETDGMAGDQLFQAPCDGRVAWQLWDHDHAQDGSGTDVIWNPVSNLYLDVSGGSASRGAAIDAWPFNGYDYDNYPFLAGPRNQEFYLEDA